jgi:hypothetical protein
VNAVAPQLIDTPKNRASCRLTWRIRSPEAIAELIVF